MPYTDRFGFLNHPKEIDFWHGRMKPCAEFSERLQLVQRHENVDGFMYPPLIQTYRGSFDDPALSEPVPNTVRPARTFSMPMSHELHIENPLANTDERHEDGGLIIHLTAFFFGTRLQFDGWRLDGRVPTKPANNFLYSEDVPADFIRSVYEKWRTWSLSLRRRYTNILYMHTRADSCIWDWDRFTYRYMVFDAICKFHQESECFKFSGHRNRLIEICRHYKIPINEQTINDIVRLRNDLFHEALWDGATPGQRTGDSFLAQKWLGNLNARLIVAAAGYANDFTRHGWWFFGWEPFDKFSANERSGSG